MIYKFYEIGKPVRDIFTTELLDVKAIKQLLQCELDEQVAFVVLRNGHVLCVNSDAGVMSLPYNPAFTEKDFVLDIQDRLRGNILEGKLSAVDEFIGVE